MRSRGESDLPPFCKSNWKKSWPKLTDAGVIGNEAEVFVYSQKSTKGGTRSEI
jgi:hypothetical protein